MRQLFLSLVIFCAGAAAMTALADGPKTPRVLAPPNPNRITPASVAATAPKMERKLGALSVTSTRGVVIIDPANVVTLARRLPSGGVDAALHMKPTGEWDTKPAISAPPNIVHDLAELAAYFDQVVASAP